MISTEDYVWFVDRAIEQMEAILVQLGDELASERPALSGANSPYGIVSHCLGVMNSWAGQRIAGREVVRDREAEFVASGPVKDLLAKTGAAKTQLRGDIAWVNVDAPLLVPAGPADVDLPFGQRQGAALMHIYEELSQHLGQLEITRDLLLTATSATTL